MFCGNKFPRDKIDRNSDCENHAKSTKSTVIHSHLDDIFDSVMLNNRPDE